MADIFIAGVPFMALGHHDGRFVRAPGLFAFARREASSVYTVLHLELTAAINREAGSGHARWSWALGEGMDSLLVHLFGRLAQVPADTDPALETVLWHAEAQALLLIEDSAAAGLALPHDAPRHLRAWRGGGRLAFAKWRSYLPWSITTASQPGGRSD